MEKSVVVVVAIVVGVVVVNEVNAQSPMVKQQLLLQDHPLAHSPVHQKEWLEHLPLCQSRILHRALVIP
jgi:hypothetical protein